MKKFSTITILLGTMILFQGCAETKTYVPVQQASNKYFTANIKPVPDSLYKGFMLTINNNSNNDIEIDWNRTMFIENGRTNGTFMFEGVLYRDRNQQKAPDIVFAKSTFTKKISPNNYVSFYRGWHHDPLKKGRMGVFLSTTVNGMSIRQKIFIDIVDKKQK